MTFCNHYRLKCSWNQFGNICVDDRLEHGCTQANGKRREFRVVWGLRVISIRTESCDLVLIVHSSPEVPTLSRSLGWQWGHANGKRLVDGVEMGCNGGWCSQMKGGIFQKSSEPAQCCKKTKPAKNQGRNFPERISVKTFTWFFRGFFCGIFQG